MNTSLTKLKPFYILALLLLLLGLILILFFILKPIFKPKEPRETFNYQPIEKQPVVNGKFDEKAPVSQKSKASLEKLLSKLPYRQIIDTSTGEKVTFVVFSNPKVLYTLYVEIDGINFQSTYSDPELAKNVQSFRETATSIFDWLEKQGVKPNELFISWGSLSFQQKSAEAWLNVSPQFPKVIKQGNNFAFETEPQK